MAARRDSFSKHDVTVTLTGEEWFALLCRLGGRSLSAKGSKIYDAATSKLQSQIVGVSLSLSTGLQEGGEQ
jgi:hypothetical protein